MADYVVFVASTVTLNITNAMKHIISLASMFLNHVNLPVIVNSGIISPTTTTPATPVGHHYVHHGCIPAIKKPARISAAIPL